MAWAIPNDKIVFPKNFKSEVRDVANALNRDFGGGPLVVGVAVHEKILRLTCAFAVLSGQINEGQLILTTKNLRYADEFLRMTLEKPSFGYSDYVREFQRAQKSKTDNVDFIRGLITLHPALKSLLSSSGFRGFQFQEVLGIDRGDSSKILSQLITRGLVRGVANAVYVPDKLLMDVAKQIEI